MAIFHLGFLSRHNLVRSFIFLYGTRAHGLRGQAVPHKTSSQCANGVKQRQELKTRAEESEESDLGGRQLG